MAKRENVSMSVIKRLPRYYRFLSDLDNNGVTRISSRELSQRMNLTASQIRQDLNCFGGFGQQGYGYNVEQLYKEIGQILGVDRGHKTILIGAGNLGRALASHMSFEKKGFNLIGIFDRNEAVAGQMVRGIPVRHVDGLEDFCINNHPRVAVLCIPRDNVQSIVELLISLGIKGFWNFTHYDFAGKYPDVYIENVHLGDTLMTLCYGVNQLLEKDEA